MKRAVVFLNGELKGNQEFYQNYISDDDQIYCADGGADYAYQLNLTPNLILGDLDSVSTETMNFYQNKGVKFKEYPAEKNKSDTEILLEKLLEKDYDQLILFAALGGRFDHALANLYTLERLFNSKTKIKIVTPKNQIEIIKNKKIIKGKQGKTVSLLPLSKEVKGVTLNGFKYKLKDDILKRGSSLGLSNIVKKDLASIKIKAGTLLLLINY